MKLGVTLSQDLASPLRT